MRRSAFFSPLLAACLFCAPIATARSRTPPHIEATVLAQQRGYGARWHRPIIMCFPGHDADRQVTSGSHPPASTRRASGCPIAVWQEIARGHGPAAHDEIVPLNVPATRHAQIRTPGSCCYAVPPAPGSPMG